MSNNGNESTRRYECTDCGCMVREEQREIHEELMHSEQEVRSRLQERPTGHGSDSDRD